MVRVMGLGPKQDGILAREAREGVAGKVNEVPDYGVDDGAGKVEGILHERGEHPI